MSREMVDRHPAPGRGHRRGADGRTRYCRVTNDTRGALLASNAVLATTSRERRRGLIGRDGLEPGEALIILRCRHVHTFGMRFAIDVLFVDGSGGVVLTRQGLSPRRISPVAWGARQAIELPAGTLERTGTIKGDRVSLDDRMGPRRPHPA
ncbi:MAG: DUF192 domain-containing protein [Actinobacteria bacterium]|nr:DUF192 domain-containing protein [Actinomycetota bacterium]MBU4302117.1 DUF192 domain-containing protein [Actinomycetota bacterium]MBU4386385.1 DUF192 domain-containing protein [Actinomycetota bacterium]MBU4489798.1 DUF192 domain-containing protein [Actinomycetota bacterium]MCG2794327.1 DUF192 domain-containing protein [Actinomycetes bacterium]